MGNVNPGHAVALFIGALLLFPAPKEANAGRDWTIAGNAGANIAWAASGPSSNKSGSPRIGLAFEGSLEKRLSPRLSISAGLRYTQKGVNSELLSFGRLRVDGELLLDYIEIPLHLRYRWTKKGWSPFVFGVIAYGISKNRELSLDQFSFINIDVNERFNTPDIVLDLGAGAEMKLSPGVSLRLWAQYGHGLQDLDNNNQTTYHSRTVTLGVGFAHRL